MSSCYITISYHILCSFILCLLLIWSPFHSILFYFISNRFDLIWFYSLLLNSIYCIVQYSISYQWMICVYLSVRPSVCLSVCVFICMNKFMFCRFFLFLFFLLFLYSLFLWTSSSHTHWHGHTHTYEYMFLLMTRTYYFKRW